MIDGKTIVAVILARAGSKGLPNKCVVPVLGRPMITYTFDHAKAARGLDGIVLTTDSWQAADLARQQGVDVVDRPAELASDKVRVDESVRHAVLQYEARHVCRVDAVVILYGNIPVRAAGAIDRAAEHLVRCGGDSVRTVAPVGKMHPDWMHKLNGDKLRSIVPTASTDARTSSRCTTTMARSSPSPARRCSTRLQPAATRTPSSARTAVRSCRALTMPWTLTSRWTSW